MGRTPEHVAGFFTAFAGAPSVWAKTKPIYYENVVKFYEKMRDESLYVAYTIVPPQIDRSKPAHQQADPTLYAGVVEENERRHRDQGRADARHRRGDWPTTSI